MKTDMTPHGIVTETEEAIETDGIEILKIPHPLIDHLPIAIPRAMVLPVVVVGDTHPVEAQRILHPQVEMDLVEAIQERQGKIHILPLETGNLDMIVDEVDQEVGSAVEDLVVEIENEVFRLNDIPDLLPI